MYQNINIILSKFLFENVDVSMSRYHNVHVNAVCIAVQLEYKENCANQGHSCSLYMAKINYTKKHYPIITEEITPEPRNTQTKMICLILFSLPQCLNLYYTSDRCILVVFLFANGSDKIISVISSITNNNDMNMCSRILSFQSSSILYEDKIRMIQINNKLYF